MSDQYIATPHLVSLNTRGLEMRFGSFLQQLRVLYKIDHQGDAEELLAERATLPRSVVIWLEGFIADWDAAIALERANYMLPTLRIGFDNTAHGVRYEGTLLAGESGRYCACCDMVRDGAGQKCPECGAPWVRQ